MNRQNPHVNAAAFPPAHWKRASACGPDGGNCVETNASPAGYVGIRDSKSRSSRHLVFNVHGWRSFLTAARAGWSGC